MTKKVQEKKPNHLLRQARIQRGWSQERVAQELEVSPQTVSRWECGSAFPYPHFREKLCMIFAKSVEELGLLQDKDEGGPEGSSAPPSSTMIDETSDVQQSLPNDQAAFLSSIWNVPYRRNAFFTGREDILQSLHETSLGQH